MAKYKVLYTDTCFPDLSVEQAELAKIDEKVQKYLDEYAGQ